MDLVIIIGPRTGRMDSELEGEANDTYPAYLGGSVATDMY